MTSANRRSTSRATPVAAVGLVPLASLDDDESSSRLPASSSVLACFQFQLGPRLNRGEVETCTERERGTHTKHRMCRSVEVQLGMEGYIPREACAWRPGKLVSCSHHLPHAAPPCLPLLFYKPKGGEEHSRGEGKCVKPHQNEATSAANKTLARLKLTAAKTNASSYRDCRVDLRSERAARSRSRLAEVEDKVEVEVGLDSRCSSSL